MERGPEAFSLSLMLSALLKQNLMFTLPSLDITPSGLSLAHGLLFHPPGYQPSVVHVRHTITTQTSCVQNSSSYFTHLPRRVTLVDMPPTPATTPGRVGCSACENATTPGSDKNMPAYSYGSGSVGRALGLRSLDTFRSVRSRSLRDRSALGTATNQKTAEVAAPATSVSAGSSPVSPPAKQRWYDSLRARASQIPTPSSPTSMSSTLKRARFFRSSPTQVSSPDFPFPSEVQNQSSRAPGPLPRLDISSFQSELQRMPIFGKASENPTQDIVSVSTYLDLRPASRTLPDQSLDTNLKSGDTTSNEAFGANMDGPIGHELGSPVVLATDELNVKPSLPVAAVTTELKAKSALSSAVSELKLKPKVAFINVPAEEEDWTIQCALYYKGSPWQTERTETFPDAASALSHIALRDMLSGRRRCSNVVLWTGQIPYTTPRTKQTFTVYPHYDGPRRIEIEEKYCLEWAFIAFTDGSKGTKLPPMKSKELSKEDKRLMSALKNVIQLGYHVDVWTCRDNENWQFDVDCIRDFGMKKMVAERQQDAETIARRERYEAFIRHGVAGFSQDDINLLFNKLHEDRDDEEEDDYDYAHDAYEHEADDVQQSQVHTQTQTQAAPDSELHGYLEHQEETITEEGDVGDAEESSEGPEISIHSEDLEMAARLG